MFKIDISMSTLLYFGAIALLEGKHFLSLAFAVFIHEAGHILCAKLLKIKINRMFLSPLGARIEIDDNIPYFNELMLSLAGPVFGILGCGFGLALSHLSINASGFAFISLALSLFNLLPLATLDGGRVIFCLCALVFDLEFAERFLRILTFLTLFAIWLFSAYIMIKFAWGLSAFVFCTIFFLKCFVFKVEN